LFLFQAFSSIRAVGFTRQHPQKAKVTKRTAGVKVKISEQENADRSYVSVTNKMIFFCKTATRLLKLMYFAIHVTRLHKRHDKMSSLYTEAFVSRHGIIFFLVFLVCSSTIPKKYLKSFHKYFLSNSLFNGILKFNTVYFALIRETLTNKRKKSS